mmetsp:Transcript_12693/g.32463  ORF Transcript_12693/g.32463 Transcript_12693/m.32463 type:complete len:241 (-) Transcript_12693:2004-2726(-)
MIARSGRTWTRQIEQLPPSVLVARATGGVPHVGGHQAISAQFAQGCTSAVFASRSVRRLRMNTLVYVTLAIRSASMAATVRCGKTARCHLTCQRSWTRRPKTSAAAFTPLRSGTPPKCASSAALWVPTQTVGIVVSSAIRNALKLLAALMLGQRDAFRAPQGTILTMRHVCVSSAAQIVVVKVDVQGQRVGTVTSAVALAAQMETVSKVALRGRLHTSQQPTSRCRMRPSEFVGRAMRTV